MDTAYQLEVIIRATVSNYLVQIILENQLEAILLTFYTVMTFLLLLKCSKRITTSIDHVRITSNEPDLTNEHTNQKDKIGRFFNEEKIVNIDSSVHEFLINKKPFLQHKYSLSELATDVNVPLHYLSAFINRYYKMSFNHFINRYRVSECKQRIMNGEWKHKTLEAIASEAGFSNRNTFTTAFKKETGITPFEYLQVLKKLKQDEPASKIFSLTQTRIESAV